MMERQEPKPLSFVESCLSIIVNSGYSLKSYCMVMWFTFCVFKKSESEDGVEFLGYSPHCIVNGPLHRLCEILMFLP